MARSDNLGIRGSRSPPAWLTIGRGREQSRTVGIVIVMGLIAWLVASVGFLTTALTIALSLILQPDEANKPLALLKIVGGCGALLLVGVWLYLAGSRRKYRPSRN